MAVKIEYSNDIKEKMMQGINALADTVKVTLGPKGRNVVIYQKAELQGAEYSDKPQKGAHGLVTNDGVTIAKSIVLPDPFGNMGAQLMKGAAEKTNEIAGDGTTTATILAQAILQNGMRYLAAGANPIQMRRGISAATDHAVQALKDMACPVTTREKISQVAAISCQDQELGNMIGQAMDTVGLEGVIEINETGRPETTMEILEGIVFDRGFASPLMATDEKQTVAELQNPYIIFYDGKIDQSQDLIPILIKVAEEDRSCLILSDGVEGSALGLILKNKIEGDLNIVCVTSPAYAEGRKWRLEDMAVQTGGRVISADFDLKLRDATLDMLGTAESVRVTKYRTVITGGGGDLQAIEQQVRKLQCLVRDTDYEFNKNRYRERLSQFVSGVARIDVGGYTETEIWERKMRVEDAANAARAAYENGIVPGGGTALLNVIPRIADHAEKYQGDEKMGYQLLLKALEAPARQIAINAGLNDSVIVGKIMESLEGTGFDAEKERYVDMNQAGIIDPVKVVISALVAATSVAATVLTGEAGTAEI